MIVFIDGCRAVGVPARQAYTPYWTYQDNNHAWTEVLGDDGNWWDAESARDVPAPGNTWVTQGCERTAFVFSIPFGLPDPSDPDIYRYVDTPGSRYAILNSIPYYRDATELKINVIGIDGTPMPDTDVYFSIWNYGALRPVAKLAESLAPEHPDLAQRAEQVRGKVEFLLKELESRSLAELRKKSDTARDQLERARTRLFPNGGLQERTLSAYYFLGKYGPGLVDELLETLPMDTALHHFGTIVPERGSDQ